MCWNIVLSSSYSGNSDKNYRSSKDIPHTASTTYNKLSCTLAINQPSCNLCTVCSGIKHFGFAA